MKKILIIGVIVLVLVLICFVVAALIPPSGVCTEVAYSCINVNGERRGNSCNELKPLFVSGLVNISNSCSGNEMLVCDNNQEVRTYFKSNGDCKIVFGILSLN